MENASRCWRRSFLYASPGRRCQVEWIGKHCSLFFVPTRLRYTPSGGALSFLRRRQPRQFYSTASPEFCYTRQSMRGVEHLHA